MKKHWYLLVTVLILVYFGIEINNRFTINSSRAVNMGHWLEVKDLSQDKYNPINDEKTLDKTDEEKEVIADKYYINNIPFTTQAPNADWKDEKQQDGCEEASVVMAEAWFRSEKKLPKDEALKRILMASDWFLAKLGTFHDAGVDDVVRILKEYYQINNVEIIEQPTIKQLKENISQSKIILVPTNGRLLGNPNFSGSGPERHMILLKGYDDKTGEFITNDPGTRKGEDYRYSYEVVLNAILAYPTGYHEIIETPEKKVIVVGK